MTKHLKALRTTAPLALSITALLAASSCSREESTTPAPTPTGTTATSNAVAADLVPAPALTAESWTNGFLTSTGVVVPENRQKGLPNVVLGGVPFVKSNNPEKFTSTGWLVQHAYTHPTRGGNNTWLSGNFNIYVSHLNGTGALAYLQVILVNPHSTPITVSYRGSILTSGEAGDANGVIGKSNYYTVSERLLTLPTTVTTKVIPAGGAVFVALKTMNPSGSADGTLFVNAGSPGVFTYVVATATDKIEEGLALASASATRRPAAGNIKPPSTAAFGTEAGVYAFSKVTADAPVPLPAGIGHIGLTVNYAGYTPIPNSSFIQTAPPSQNGSGQTLRLGDSAYRTCGNYNHEYNINLRLQNPLSRPRRVRVWFAANAITADRQLLYNGAFQFNGSGPVKVLITPATSATNRPKQELTADVNGNSLPLTVAAGATLNVPLRFFIPGLASAGSHIILETQD
ncbi:hypothetical protein [Hymenobacter terrenus]|uniref:hypothetical protein n=1 Tax=Hymenobacter terrenus TaxID=1629124 RepID=UPI000619B09D|nr:hypothetical protein [Hymenobacter terrenus]